MGRRSASASEMSLEERLALGAKVDEMARAAGSRQKAADYAGVSLAQLARIIAGTTNPSAVSLARLASRTGHSLDWVMNVIPEGPQRRVLAQIAAAEKGPEAPKVQEFSALAIRINEALKAAHREELGRDPPVPLDEVAGALTELIWDARAGEPEAEVIQVAVTVYKELLSALRSDETRG